MKSHKNHKNNIVKQTNLARTSRSQNLFATRSQRHEGNIFHAFLGVLVPWWREKFSAAFRVPKKEKGFTLIDVLFAIAILAFGLLAVAKMQGSAIQGNFFAGGKTEAVTLAQDRMERLLALQYGNSLLDPGVDLPDPFSPSPVGYAIVYDVDNVTLTNAKIITLTVTPRIKGVGQPIQLTCVKPQL